MLDVSVWLLYFQLVFSVMVACNNEWLLVIMRHCSCWMGSMEDFSFSYEVHRSHASLCFTEWGETNFIVNFINIYLHISYYNNLFQLHPFSHWILLPFYVWLLRLVLKEHVKWKIYSVCLFVLIKSIKMWERTCFRKCEICSLNSV